MNGYEDTECEKYFTPPEPQPDQSRLIDLLPIDRTDVPESVSWEFVNQAIARQRDLTAREKDAEIKEAVKTEHEYMIERAVDEGNDAYKRGVEFGQNAYIEALIEWLEGDCPHVSHHRARHWCGECWDELKATHTSKD